MNFFLEEVSKHALKKGYSECLAEAVVVNGSGAAHLSKSIRRILKGETKMAAYSELQVSEFTFEEFEKYVVRDEYGAAKKGINCD